MENDSGPGHLGTSSTPRSRLAFAQTRIDTGTPTTSVGDARASSSHVRMRHYSQRPYPRPSSSVVQGQDMAPGGSASPASDCFSPASNVTSPRPIAGKLRGNRGSSSFDLGSFISPPRSFTPPVLHPARFSASSAAHKTTSTGAKEVHRLGTAGDDELDTYPPKSPDDYGSYTNHADDYPEENTESGDWTTPRPISQLNKFGKAAMWLGPRTVHVSPVNRVDREGTASPEDQEVLSIDNNLSPGSMVLASTAVPKSRPGDASGSEHKSNDSSLTTHTSYHGNRRHEGGALGSFVLLHPRVTRHIKQARIEAAAKEVSLRASDILESIEVVEQDELRRQESNKPRGQSLRINGPSNLGTNTDSPRAESPCLHTDTRAFGNGGSMPEPSDPGLNTEPPESPRLPSYADEFEDDQEVRDIEDNWFDYFDPQPLRDVVPPSPSLSSSVPTSHPVSYRRASTQMTQASLRKLEISKHKRCFALRGIRYPGYPPSPLGPFWKKSHGKD